MSRDVMVLQSLADGTLTSGIYQTTLVASLDRFALCKVWLETEDSLLTYYLMDLHHRDVHKSQDRDETETLNPQDRDETETFQKTSRDRDVQDRVYPCCVGCRVAKHRFPISSAIAQSVGPVASN